MKRKTEKINKRTFDALCELFTKPQKNDNGNGEYDTYFPAPELKNALKDGVDAIRLHYEVFEDSEGEWIGSAQPDDTCFLCVRNEHKGYLDGHKETDKHLKVKYFKVLCIYRYKHNDDRACKGLSSIIPSGCLIKAAKNLGKFDNEKARQRRWAAAGMPVVERG